MSKPTLGELIAQKAALEQQIAELQHTQRAEAIAQIRALMNEYGLTLTDIGARSPAAQQAAARADGRGTGKVAPKYLVGPRSADALAARGHGRRAHAVGFRDRRNEVILRRGHRGTALDRRDRFTHAA
jgi:DNA-binding protein H-NS